MFTRLGRAVARHAWVTITTWIVLVAAALSVALFGVGGQGLFDRLHSGEPMVDGSEYNAGMDILEGNKTSSEQLVLALTDVDLGDLAAVSATMDAFHADMADVKGVTSFVDPFLLPGGLENPIALTMVSEDGFLVQIDLDKDLTEDEIRVSHDSAVALMSELAAALGGEGIVSSSQIMVDEVTDQIQKDLQKGEVYALPISLVIMVVVFGGFLAASMPLIGALASIAAGLGALWGFSYLLDLDGVVVNVVSILGLGLSIDYGLLIVSRYREELRESIDHADPQQGRRDRAIEAAVTRTVATAGRTVTFSAVTVAVSIAGLMLFNLEILRSLGAAGVSVVLIAVASALTLVPAILTVLGRRMAKPSLLMKVPGLNKALAKFGDVPPAKGVFSRLATVMQKRPWLAVIGTLLVLGVLASPVLNMQMRNSTVELLPPDSDQRVFLDILEDNFPAAVAAPIIVIALEANSDDLGTKIDSVEGVTSVNPAEPVGEGWVQLGVRIDSDDTGGDVATDVVHGIRAFHDSADDFFVVGQAANQIDFTEALLEGLPWAVSVVILATFILLFLMTGSVLVPLKALLINVVSLGASLGVTSWIFAEGHLSNLLNFESAGGLESYVVAVVVAFGFGLAMDYEVFLLARIKELHDTGLDNNTSVRDGLQLSGRIITSAALVIIVVFGGFVAGDMLAIKQVGIALAITVFVDATLVRMVLVPATMTLLGEWNWWAPKPLRKLHAKIGLHH